jgi:NADPH:quinone reductase
MKAILCKQHGLPNTLVLEEVAAPKPSSKQVLIDVKACSANFPDTLIIQNLYQFKPELPFSPGSEVAGIITEVGEGVKHLKAGDRVLALCGWGGFAEQIAVDANRVFPIADNMDYVTAASIMYNFGTSHHALKDRANLLKGETLLVLGAAGGVGLAAVELGKMMGATVIAAASSQEKLLICKEKGADFLINYEIEDLKEKLKELTNGKGVDVVYDPIGDKYAEPCIRSMAWKGRYLVVGFAAGQIPKIALNLALLKGCSLMGVFWGQFATLEPDKNLKNILQLADFMSKGLVSPHIFKLYSLKDASHALEDLMNRKVIGKAVVVMGDDVKMPIYLRPSVKEKNMEAPVTINNGKVIFNNFDQINAFVGQPFGTTEWLEVSQDMIDGFAEATLDKQWIHIDTEKAKASPFGQTIAHGLLTLSLTPKFMYELYEVIDAKMGINYGTEKVRFLSPVLSGSRLRMSAVLKETAEMPNNGLKMIVEATIEIENQKKPACVADLISIVYI